MTKYNFLCADIGTTSLKAALVSETGQVLSFSKIDFFTLSEFSSSATSSIANIWFKALQNAITNIKNELQISGSFNLDAICISGNGPTIVSEDGTTLLWNQKIPLQAELYDKYKTSLFLPRLQAFKNLYPQKVCNQKIFSGPEFLIWKLSNTQITILPEERYKAAYWDDEALSLIGIDSSLIGKFVSPGFNCGTITEQLCIELDLSPDTKIIAGGPDFTVAMIGTNTLAPGKLCNRAGSSEGLNWCTSKPVFAPNVRTLPSVISGLWNASFLLTSSGTKIEKDKENFELQNKIKISYKDYIDKCLNKNDMAGFKTLQELSSFISESVKKFRELANENNLPIFDTVMITGGQAKNKQWLQHKANVAKINFGITEVTDSELIGDAVLAAYGLGLFDSIQQASEQMVKPKIIFKPEK